MTRDEIIKMAELCDLGQVCGPLSTLLDHEWESLHRFAALVATAEREACAKVCEHRFSDGALVLAAAIRARGATKPTRCQVCGGRGRVNTKRGEDIEEVDCRACHGDGTIAA